MRVNELSKQIGKSNKEVLEILQKNNFDIKSHSSNVTEEQADTVRRFFAKANKQIAESKSDMGKVETNRVEDIKKEPVEAEKKETEKTAEPPKKRIAAVYRPQNSVQRGTRQAAKTSSAQAPKSTAQATRQAAGNTEQPAQTAQTAQVAQPVQQTKSAAQAQAEKHDNQKDGYQGKIRCHRKCYQSAGRKSGTGSCKNCFEAGN